MARTILTRYNVIVNVDISNGKNFKLILMTIDSSKLITMS